MIDVDNQEDSQVEDIFFDWDAQNGNFNHAFASVNPEWEIIYMNKAAERLFCFEKSAGKISFWDVCRRVIPPAIASEYRDRRTSDLPEVMSQYFTDGEDAYISNTFYSNRELSIHVRSADNFEPEVSRPTIVKKLYYFITEITSECLWDWNLHSHEFFWVDGGHHKMLGYDLENVWIPESFWMNRIHAEDRVRVKDKIQALLENGKDRFWDCAYRFQDSKGKYHHVHDRGHIFYDEDGSACRIFGATQNETEKFISQNKLEEIQKQLSLIVQQTVNAIIITDHEGAINYVNNAFTTCTGYEQMEVMGKKPGAFLQGAATSPETVAYLRSRIRRQLPFDCEILNYNKQGGQIWIRLQGQPFNDGTENNQSYFSVQTDITEQVLRKQRAITENEEHKIAITKAVLTALENERDEIGKEIHDNLNHTLVASKLYLELAKSNDEHRTVYLDKSLGYINSVIENIRRISKKLVTPELMGLVSSVKSLLEDLMIVYPIKFSLSHDLIEKELTENLKLNIFRIIQEQLTNIVKHSRAKRATIKLAMSEGAVIVSINDNGIGSDLLTEAHGVGLRNIRSRAALFAGNVEIISKPGKGFRLMVTMQVK